MGMIQEFKEFALKGNMVDMAVGIIIGGAVGKLVGSLVDNVIMPFVSIFTGGVDFSQLFLNLSTTDYPTLKAAQDAGAPVLKYGSFLQTALDFLILAFVIFMLVKAINRLRKPAPAAAPAPSEEVKLLTEIRDALKRK